MSMNMICATQHTCTHTCTGIFGGGSQRNKKEIQLKASGQRGEGKMKVPGCQKQPCHCPAVSHWLLFGKEGVGTCSSVCIWSQSCAGSSSPGILESWEMENQSGFIAFDYFWKAGRQKVLSLLRLELHVDTDQTLKFTIQKFQFGFRLCPSICWSKVLPAGDC